MRHILLGGPAGSGKSTIAGILRDKFQLPFVNIGDVLRENLRMEGVPCSTRSEIGPRFLEHHPAEQIFRLVRERIADGEDCSIDGVRLALTCKQFKEWDASVEVWFVEVPDNLRSLRLRKKLNEEHPSKAITDKELEQARTYDTEQPLIQSFADVVVCNDGSLEDLAVKVGKAFAKNSTASVRV